MYERELKNQNPNKRQITYDIQNLFQYIDNLPDLSCLVYVKHYIHGFFRSLSLIFSARISKSLQRKAHSEKHIINIKINKKCTDLLKNIMFMNQRENNG